MATEFINGQWRIPNDWDVDESNQDKISNYSMDFNGVSDKIEFGNINGFERTDSFTFSLWVNITSYAGTYYYISKQLATGVFRGYLLFSGTGGELQFLLNSTFDSSTLRVNSSSQIPLNQWVHLVLTYDGSSSASGVNMYFNSVLQTIITVNDNLTTSTLNTTEFQISGRDGGNGNLVGKIDQVSVFDYALSQAQVTTLYGNSAAGYFQIGNPMALTPNPVTFYPLGDQDLIGAGYNGANWLVPNQVATSLSSYVFSFTTTGSAQRINIPSITIGAEFTTSFWFNSNLSLDDQLLTEGYSGSGPRGNYPFLSVEVAGIRAVIGDSVDGNSLLPTTVPFVINDWFHIAIVQSSGIAKLYINGNLESTGGANSARFPNVTVIANRLNGTFGLQGEMSNIAFFNTPLQATGIQSIASLYNGGTPPDLTSYSNLLRWYRLNSDDTFDGTDWTIKDSVSSSNNGTSVNMSASSLVVSNLPNTAAGYSPYAIQLDGTSENFTVDNSSEDLNVDYLTVSVWFKPDALQQFKTLIGNRYFDNGYMSWALQLKNDGTIRYMQRSPDVGVTFVTTDTYNEGEWNHVAVTYDGTNAKIYLNGGTPVVYAVTGPIQYQSGFINDNVTIGAAPDNNVGAGPAQFFDGQLSNVAVWGSGLSAAQVATIYNNGIPGDISSLNPLAWWELGSMMGFNGVDTYTALSNTNTNYAAVSTANMAGGNVVNGPGYLNGGTGTSSLVIEKQAPYSFNNALSENMAISNRDDSQASDPRPFIMQLNLTAEASSFVYQTGTVQFAVYPYTVNWGDGNIERILDATQLVSFKLQHTYDTDTYPRPVIEITTTPEDVAAGGSFNDYRQASQGSRNQLAEIKQFGQTPWVRFSLYGATEVSCTASDSFKLSPITNFGMSNMFREARKFNPPTWNNTENTSRITALGQFAFYRAHSFNQDMDKWDTSSVRPGQTLPGFANPMNYNFYNCFVFNGNIDNWCITRGGSGQSNFDACSAFNRDIRTKIIPAGSSPTGVEYVAWNTENITSLLKTFSGASVFNGDISNWNTSSLTSTALNQTFFNANAFNRDVNTKIIPAGSSPTGLEYTAWDTTGVTNFYRCFYGADLFNQNLQGWNILSIPNNPSTIQGLIGIFSYASALSDNNYTDTIVGWAVQVYNNSDTPSGIDIGTQHSTFNTTRTENQDNDGGTPVLYSTLYGSDWPASWNNSGDAKDYLELPVASGGPEWSNI